MKRILVCGSRSWTNRQVIHDILSAKKAESDLTIIEGDAHGADRIAGLWADVNDCGHEVYPANWKTHGRQAGFIRNSQMLNAKPDLVIAFWDGKSNGTRDTITKAKQMGIPVEVYDAL